jgi:hypothetical protein
LSSDDRAIVDLWLSVLSTAIRDTASVIPSRRAMALFYLKSRSEHPGSVAWICNMLGVEPSAVIAQLSTAKGRRFARLTARQREQTQ